jgi:hypothetical protein
LQPEHLGFGTYLPTLPELYGKILGPGNCTFVPTGRIIDQPDPTGEESAEATAYQNRELAIYVRDPEVAAQHPEYQTADVLRAALDEQFPNLVPVVVAG